MWDILHILEMISAKEVINIIDLKFIQEKIKNYKDGALGTSLGVDMSGHSEVWKKGFAYAIETIEGLIKEYLVEAEKETLDLIDELIPDDYWMLRNFAKEQPKDFYIDDRVSIKNKKKIYEAVGRLADIRRSL